MIGFQTKEICHPMKACAQKSLKSVKCNNVFKNRYLLSRHNCIVIEIPVNPEQRRPPVAIPRIASNQQRP